MARSYEKLAELYSDAVFLKLYGNANLGCKQLFKHFKVRSTPSFLFFRNGEQSAAAVSISVDDCGKKLKWLIRVDGLLVIVLGQRAIQVHDAASRSKEQSSLGRLADTR